MLTCFRSLVANCPVVFFFFFLLPVTVSLGGFAASFMFHHLSVTFKSESSFCKVMGDEYRL